MDPDMSSYHSFVREFAAVLEEAKRAVPSALKTQPAHSGPDAPVALLFSPHPDDECITGLLPLRLAAECGWRIVNVPVTHGSNPERQAARHEELEAACDYLGWDLARSPDATDTHFHPAYGVEEVLDALTEYRPSAVFFPHNRDWNSRHVSTHDLLLQALTRQGPDGSCMVVETEFWGAMDDPNLMVEASEDHLGDLITALRFHEGEVQRNPYHLRLPSWMVDNVRRGAERIAGQGKGGPDFTFATLYRLCHWDGNTLSPILPSTLSVSQSPESLFSC